MFVVNSCKTYWVDFTDIEHISVSYTQEWHKSTAVSIFTPFQDGRNVHDVYQHKFL